MVLLDAVVVPDEIMPFWHGPMECLGGGLLKSRIVLIEDLDYAILYLPAASFCTDPSLQRLSIHHRCHFLCINIPLWETSCPLRTVHWSGIWWWDRCLQQTAGYCISCTLQGRKLFRSSQTRVEGEFLHSLAHGTSSPVSINSTVGNPKVS